MNSRSGNIWKFTNNYFYPKDHYYSTLVDKYDDPNFFRDLIAREYLIPFKTRAELIFRSKIPFGSELKFISAEIGKPHFTYKRADFHDYKILFYRTSIGGEKAKIELHMLHGKLVIYNYIFSYLTPSEKDNLLRILSLKYLDNTTLDIKGYKVMDKNKNFMLVKDSVDLSIWYISGNHEFTRQLINNQLNMEVQKEQKVKRRNQEFLHFL